jgi:putative inorganic carbon (hco3(-)) transporter
MQVDLRSRQAAELRVGGVLVPAAGAAVLLGALAVYSPKDAVVALLGAAFVFTAVWRLPLAIAAFIVLTFPEHLPGSFGAGDTLAKPVGALILLAWAGYVLVRRGDVPLLPRERPLLFWLIVAFLVFGGVSTLWAVDPGQTRHELSRFLQVAALLVVVYTAGSSRGGFRVLVRGYLVASAVTSVYSLAYGTYVGAGRLATLFDPNYFAAELLPAVAIAMFVLVTADTWRVRFAVGAILGVDLVAFVLTESRGGIVGLAITLVLAVLLAGRARPRLLALVLVLVAVGVGYYFGYKPAHVFQTSPGGGLSAASSGRLDEWHIATRIFETHPLGGVGLGNYSVAEQSYATQTFNLQFVSFILRLHHAAHNTYLQVTAELGILGILLFLGVLAVPFRLALKAVTSLRSRADSLEFDVRGLIVGAAGMVVAYIFLTAEWEKQLWLVLGLLACAPSILGAARAESEQAPPDA